MEIIKFSLGQEVKSLGDITLCLGYFDGLHQGHMELINKAKSFSNKVAVVSFDPSPKYFISGKKEEEITTLRDRTLILESLGVDYFIIIKFNKAMMNLSGEDFVKKIIIPLGTKQVVVGDDYRFGYQAQAGFYQLGFWGLSKYKVCEVPQLTYKNKKISSSDIISLIKNGDVSYANRLLGRAFKIHGTVVKGEGNGHKIDFPTANVDYDKNYVKPLNGVYAVRVFINNRSYLGMANVGTHPTIDELAKPILEVNVFDYDGDLYGQEIDVAFLEYVRKESKFHNMLSLKKQLKKDRDYIARQKYFD